MTDVNNDYVAKLMACLRDMLMIATDKPAIDYSDVYNVFPFWMIFPRNFVIESFAEGISKQAWRIAVIYAVAPATAGYRGEYQRALYTDVPAALNYLQAHPYLTYEGNSKVQGHTAHDIAYFQAGNPAPIERGSHFGVTSADRVMGYEFDYLAKFKVTNPALFA